MNKLRVIWCWLFHGEYISYKAWGRVIEGRCSKCRTAWEDDSENA